ncbi:MAG: hypothetical protein Q8930_20660 [Bacillota bacterium]|nr:hypothetical protein [Bacillota bacterium]
MGGKVTIREVDCLGFQGYEFSNETISLSVVPGIGGRIMSFGLSGSNILFHNNSLYGFKPEIVEGTIPELKEQRLKCGYLLYGGEKTWIAPQDDWDGPPYMDLDSGHYDMDIHEENGGVTVQLVSTICRETKLRVRRTIEIPAEGAQIAITQSIENLGEETVRKGVWQVTMVNRPSVVNFDTYGESQYEGGIKVFEDFKVGEDIIRKSDGRAHIHCEDNTVFKLGTDINKGCVETLVKDLSQVFKVEFEPTQGPYGHGCAIEVYNSAEYPYLEVEVHSPLKEIEPGSRLEHKVYWSIGRQE